MPHLYLIGTECEELSKRMGQEGLDRDAENAHRHGGARRLLAYQRLQEISVRTFARESRSSRNPLFDSQLPYGPSAPRRRGSTSWAA